MPTPDPIPDPPRVGVVLAIAIRGRRIALKLRQVDLAERLQWPVSKVTRIECGQARVHAEDLPDLCRALRMPLADLLSSAAPGDLGALGLLAVAEVGPARVSQSSGR